MKNNSKYLRSSITKKWYVIDAKGETLGRIATLIAIIVSGKHKSNYVPYKNCGDYVVVINAETIQVTGQKFIKKIYKYPLTRPGGLKTETFGKLQIRIPERTLEESVRGMLPKGSLGRDLFQNLKVYKGKNHPHISQNPELLV